MDLDFSFALVSSLTPHSKATKTQFLQTQDLSSKSLRTKQNQAIYPELFSNKLTHHNIKSGKENQSPNDHKYTEVPERNSFQKDVCAGITNSFDFSVDMANIGIRRNRGKDKTKGKLNQQQSNNDRFTSSNEETKKVPNNFNNICNGNGSSRQIEPNQSLGSEMVLNSIDNFNNSCLYLGIEKSSINRKSCSSELSKTSNSTHSSIDIIESSFDKVESTPTQNNKNENLSVIKQNSRRTLSRISGVSESSFSPAYDSDSISNTHKRGVKVIHETPETDGSLNSNTNKNGKRKSSEVTSPRIETNVTNSINIENNGRKDTFAYDRIKSSKENYGLPNPCNNDIVPVRQSRKKHRSGDNSNFTDMIKLESSFSDLFKLESSIKNKPSDVNKKGINEMVEKSTLPKEKLGLSICPVLEDACIAKDLECKTGVNKSDSSQKTKNKYIKKEVNKPLSKASTSPLVPPTEVISKFEHVSNWLKGTEESVILVGSGSPSNSPPLSLVGKTRKNAKKLKERVSLSPRIKKRLVKAQNTLQEEQKIFEELYGSNMVKRLSEDLEDEVISITSTKESVEISEKVLDKLYGTVWQNDVLFPQSEPSKSRKKTPPNKKNAPRTEKKKPRTSIYDVFSSSSSEDRFEEFLESVQKGKVKGRVRRSNRPGTPDFIKESDSDSNCSLVFYQNIVSSAVKEEVNSIRSKENKSTKARRKNQRKLSFSSCKDDMYSESGKSDTHPLDKEKKPPTKTKKKRSPKSRSNKKTESDNSENVNNLFTLVTPLKFKDKKTEDLNNLIKNIESEVPKSVGKSKTPKSSTKQEDKLNTEEKLKKKYLGEGDFKVPKHLALTKTPSRPIPKGVPSSPALSFLSSLSEMTGDLPCHPDALVYKKSFKTRREELSKKLFSLYNKEIFENKLPEDMVIQWNTRMTSTSGYCYNKRIYKGNQVFRSSRIVLSTKILDRADRLRDTLIHELCHASTWIVDGLSDGHGSKWKAWADKANRRFPELPVIKRCHDYAISTKYTYKCKTCGYCVGRHSKSLDVERKRCGYCYGTFQVFVTAKMTSTSAASDSDSVKTKRNPSGFALFVKDNYATVKKENNVPHAQVMKLLSEKFAVVKITKQTQENYGVP